MKKSVKIQVLSVVRDAFLKSFPDWSSVAHQDYKEHEGVFFQRHYSNDGFLIVAVLFSSTRDALRLYVGWGGGALFVRSEFDWEMRHEGPLAKLRLLERIPSFERAESLIDIGFLVGNSVLLKAKMYDLGNSGVVVPGFEWDQRVVPEMMSDFAVGGVSYLNFFLEKQVGKSP